MKSSRGTKLRQLPAGEPAPKPSRSRPRKPPAKELSRRKAAALSSGGGKLPPRVRRELDAEPRARRERHSRQKKPPRARAGKREPREARHIKAAEVRQARTVTRLR